MFGVAEIQDLTEIARWQYVPTKFHVADFASKWNKQPSFGPTSQWFTGPEFQMSPLVDWAIHDDKTQNTVDNETQAYQYQSLHTQQVQPIIDYNRFYKYFFFTLVLIS